MRLSAPIFRLKRQAKLLARKDEVPLHEALDRVAAGEGYRSWSHLSAVQSASTPGREIFAALEPGDLVLLGARPNQGKTILGLELVVEAVKAGRQGIFFTLDYSAATVAKRFRAMGVDLCNYGDRVTVDTSDDICAGHVIGQLAGAPSGTLAVIDYLQLLDQKREHPDIDSQARTLKAFAAEKGLILVLISQIDRAFDLTRRRMPELSDVRMPNPFDLGLFSKTCFLHEGEIDLRTAVAA